MLGLIHSIIIMIIDNNTNQPNQNTLSIFKGISSQRMNWVKYQGPQVGGNASIWLTIVSHARDLGPGKTEGIFGGGVGGEW